MHGGVGEMLMGSRTLASSRRSEAPASHIVNAATGGVSSGSFGAVGSTVLTGIGGRRCPLPRPPSSGGHHRPTPRGCAVGDRPSTPCENDNMVSKRSSHCGRYTENCEANATEASRVAVVGAAVVGVATGSPATDLVAQTRTCVGGRRERPKFTLPFSRGVFDREGTLFSICCSLGPAHWCRLEVATTSIRRRLSVPGVRESFLKGSWGSALSRGELARTLFACATFNAPNILRIIACARVDVGGLATEALRKATYHRNCGCVEPLLQLAADPNVVASHSTANVSILATSAAVGDVETCRLLLAYGASANFAEPSTGLTALHGAAKVAAVAGPTEDDKALEICRRLLIAGADINAKTVARQTPLDCALAACAAAMSNGAGGVPRRSGTSGYARSGAAETCRAALELRSLGGQTNAELQLDFLKACRTQVA
eukprot:TRINITY_DN75591_c0_g1_i1.p1 TRINITY_DN75591_c0_g1~~TRINITY_DN75591_c0_g1_i1.p1  ORF type:complete len:466 (-),score=52.77 TRINITY_DN75591_c0_g1_i1:156-1445(-)